MSLVGRLALELIYEITLSSASNTHNQDDAITSIIHSDFVVHSDVLPWKEKCSAGSVAQI